MRTNLSGNFAYYCLNWRAVYRSQIRHRWRILNASTLPL